MTTRSNSLDPFLDVRGTTAIVATKTLADEPSSLGQAVSGQTGAAANITTVSGGIATVTGLTGMSATASRGRFLTISGAASAGNNGTFLIVAHVSATSVEISNSAAVASDANNGSISWTERDPYAIQDDVNFVRTDRAAIKGVTYDAAIPTYTRPTATSTNVPANLANIAGKTTDAKAITTNRKFAAVTVAATDLFITLSDVGNLKHATATDRTGVPIQDGADAGAHEATYVEIINPATEGALEVLAGGDIGKRIFGRTRAGGSTSPDSVEVEFRAVAKGAALSTSVAYTWEAGQPTSVDMYYGFRERLDNLSDTALRTVLTNGIVGDADVVQDILDIRTTIGIGDNVTSLAGLLTNTGNFFPFVDLPDGTPSAVEAFNTLNAQIGNRDYADPGQTEVGLVDGETVTASIQKLADAIANSSVVRTIERITTLHAANTARTLPGGITYTLDGTGNGRNLWLFWRGVLRHPGTLASFVGNEYEETSTTSFTPYSNILAGDCIDYLILK